MKRGTFAVASVFMLATAHHTLAQEASSLPDPASISVPDIGTTPDATTLKTGNKYFFFHRPDTDFVQSYADLHFCTQFTHKAVLASLPAFVPWGERSVRPPIPNDPVISPYGIVGAVIGSMIAGPLERGDYLIKMRRCMEPRGYSRFPMSKAAWEAVHPAEEAQSLLMQAKLASGPRPTYQEARQ